MEILDEANLEEIEMPFFRRLLLYFIYLIIISIGIYWNTTQSFTKVWLPYDFGLPGGCYIELPIILTLGLGGVLISFILLTKHKISFWVSFKALTLVISSSSISFFIIRNFKLIYYIHFSLPYSKKIDILHGGLHFLLFIFLVEIYLIHRRRKE
jgi:hypothetical protein